MFICVGACAQHVPVRLRPPRARRALVAGRRDGHAAPGDLMVRRDLGAFARPDGLRVLRAPDRHAGLRARDPGAVTGGCSDDEGDPLIYVKGTLGPQRRGHGLLRRATGRHRREGFGVDGAGRRLRERERPRAAGPLRRAAADVHRTGQGGTRRMEFLSHRLDRCAAPGIFELGPPVRAGYQPERTSTETPQLCSPPLLPLLCGQTEPCVALVTGIPRFR